MFIASSSYVETYSSHSPPCGSVDSSCDDSILLVTFAVVVARTFVHVLTGIADAHLTEWTSAARLFAQFFVAWQLGERAARLLAFHAVGPDLALVLVTYVT